MKAISKNSVMIETVEFRWSHGREPKGRGTWAFSEKRRPDAASSDAEILWFFGTYAEARKQAIAHAASNGITRLFVQP